MRSIVNMLEDRARDMGNTHKNGKDRAFGSGDMLSDRQTHIQTHRQTRSSH